MAKQRSVCETGAFICIDLKSFYASVECVQRGLDPLTARLVVADEARGPGTICLAVSPALKALGVRNRCRLHDIPAGIGCAIAKPRMRLYMETSTRIYAIYRQYTSETDIFPYSIDECFIDANPYLRLYGTDTCGFARMLRQAVLEQTGIPATVGVGDNLFLAKVALDVMAKKAPDGIGQLNEIRFRKHIWHHRPITDIWRIGPGTARHLERFGVFDLHGVCEMDPETLYRAFGKNAEYLIDHAWGVEPCTMAEVKAYRARSASLSNGQVLPSSYSFHDARIVLREMVEALCLELTEKNLSTQMISLFCGYEHTSEVDAKKLSQQASALAKRQGKDPDEARHCGSSQKLPFPTSSFHLLWNAFSRLYDATATKERGIRRLNIGCGELIASDTVTRGLFDDEESLAKERILQQTTLAVKNRFGKNALMHGTSLQKKATGRERNEQIGGHHA